MRLRRIMLVCWIALSVAVAPIASAWASKHGGSATSGHELNASHVDAAADVAVGVVTGSAMVDMADCHKAMKTSGDCPCCDTKAKCPADAACMTKCCKVLGAVAGSARLALHPIVHGRPGEPEKPPEWLSKPPAPPPRS